MLDHVDIRVSDRDASRRFYTTVLGEPSYSDQELDVDVEDREISPVVELLL